MSDAPAGANAPPRGERRRARTCCAAVALLALVAWWPLSPYWQSDDFLAVTYASDFQRALADFAGNQYAAPALVWFYRPLITLSFALDAQIGGAEPFVAHLSNAVAHALSALLVTLIGRRLLGERVGLCLGLLFGLWPTQGGSILWAVGRVDSHTSVWILLSWLLTLRWLDTARGRPGAAVAFVLALLSKELAFMTPAVAALLGFATAPPGARMRQAWRAAWPLLAVFAVYLAWRWLVLGRLIGGYEGARFAPGASLAGFGTWTARVANPLLDADGVAGAVRWLGYLPWPIAVLSALRRGRARALALLALGYLLCAVPTAPFWAETVEGKNLRYFYLPAACLLGVLAVGGRWSTLLALLVAAWPYLLVRQHYHAAHTRARAQHTALRQADRELPPGALLVQGLPRENAARDVLMFHLFVDRLLAPPFGSGRPVFALRPLVEREGVLTVPSEACAALADCHAMTVAADGARTDLRAPPLPALAVTATGDLHLSSAALWDLDRQRATQDLHFAGDPAPHYRLTLFTGGGYLSCVLANEAPAGASGMVRLYTLLARGRYATAGDDAFVALALNVPTAFDLAPVFPLLVEAGEIRGDDPHTFRARARATRLLALRFDRDYCDWLAGRVADPRAR